jgi:hypothetical protein
MSTITETAKHLFAHGQTWLFPRTTGGLASPGLADAISLPEVDSLEVTFENEKVEHVSKRDALASKNLSVIKMVSASFKLTCSQHVAELIAVYLFGTKAAITGGSVTAVAFASGIVQNDIMPFPGDRANFSTFTSIVDSAGSPATLVNGTDYEVDEKAGVIKFLSTLAGLTQPFKITGVEAASTGVGLIQSRVQERILRHKAINIADSDKVEVVTLYRCQIDPASSWQLLNEGNEVAKYEIGGQLLKDTTKSSSATFGQYGAWRQPNA